MQKQLNFFFFTHAKKKKKKKKKKLKKKYQCTSNFVYKILNENGGLIFKSTVKLTILGTT